MLEQVAYLLAFVKNSRLIAVICSNADLALLILEISVSFTVVTPKICVVMDGLDAGA